MDFHLICSVGTAAYTELSYMPPLHSSTSSVQSSLHYFLASHHITSHHITSPLLCFTSSHQPNPPLRIFSPTLSSLLPCITSHHITTPSLPFPFLLHSNPTLPSASSLHHHSLLPSLQDPELFDPDRWLPDNPDAEKLKELYYPYSMGKRSCVGQNLAVLEIKLILASVLRSFRFQLVSQPGMDYFFALKPTNVHMRVHKAEPSLISKGVKAV